MGMHALGYVAETARLAADEFFPGYARAIASVARERGWRPVARAQFDSQLTPDGAFLYRNGETRWLIKLPGHSEALGGISRITFQMNAGSLPHARMMTAIEVLGTRVAPALHGELVSSLRSP